MATTLFDRVVMVDWSAASTPTRGDDSVWRASLDVRSGASECVNHPTRHDAEAAIVDDLSRSRGRVLVGFDFALGYPAGYAERLVKPGANWRAVWTAIDEVIDDRPDNSNNRFIAAARLNERTGIGLGPFWGCPADAASVALQATKPWSFGGVEEFRLCERRLQDAGRHPKSVWQLYGAGAVGSQTLVGIPMLRRLGASPELARRVRIWPFETGCDAVPTRAGRDAIVVCEVWPTAFGFVYDDVHVKDAQQVTAVCQHLGELDARGELGALFAPELSADEVAVVERQEGWILGA